MPWGTQMLRWLWVDGMNIDGAYAKELERENPRLLVSGCVQQKIVKKKDAD